MKGRIIGSSSHPHFFFFFFLMSVEVAPLRFRCLPRQIGCNNQPSSHSAALIPECSSIRPLPRCRKGGCLGLWQLIGCDVLSFLSKLISWAHARYSKVPSHPFNGTVIYFVGVSVSCECISPCWDSVSLNGHADCLLCFPVDPVPSGNATF